MPMSWIGTDVACTTRERGVLVVGTHGASLAQVPVRQGVVDEVTRRTRRMPGMVPTTASIRPGQLRHHGVEVGEPVIEQADDAGQLRRHLLQRPGCLGELVGQLDGHAAQPLGQRAQRGRGVGEGGQRGVECADGLLQSGDGARDAQGGDVDARARPVDARPPCRSSMVIRRSSRSAISLIASSAASAEEGSRSRAPGRLMMRLEQRR